MAFSIPDRALTYPFQSRWFESDTVILGMSAGGKNGVIVGGCEVTESAIPDGNTLVSAGQVVVDGGLVDVAEQTVGHDVADALLPRFDLVVIYDDGIAASLAGTPDAAPLVPLPDTDSVGVAQVFIPAADTAIEDEQIIDKRVFVPSPLAASSWIELNCTADLSRASNTNFTADPVMQFPVTSGGVYRVKLMAMFTTGAGGNMKSQWSGPAATRLIGIWGPAYSGTAGWSNQVFTASQMNGSFTHGFINGTSVEGFMKAEFIYVPSTSGVLAFAWGQQSASASALIRRKGSLLEYEIA